MVLPSAAGSAPALRSGCVFQARLVGFGEKRDAVNSQGGVCELLLCKYSAEDTDPGILGVPCCAMGRAVTGVAQLQNEPRWGGTVTPCSNPLLLRMLGVPAQSEHLFPAPWMWGE